MTIFDLAEAFNRFRRPVAAAFGLLLVIVVVMTFSIENGGLAFRAGLKHDSSIQIAVVAPGTVSLITTGGPSGNLSSAAELYASLLSSDEAAEWIGAENGYHLESAVSALTERNSSIITVRVTGPTPDQAKAAALSTFEWLNRKLLEPIETADFPETPPEATVVVLDRAFASFIDLNLDGGLAAVVDGLFLFVDHGGGDSIGVPVQRSAGTTVRTQALLEPVTTVVLTLATAADEVLDTIRLAPDPAPRVVEAVPELVIDLGRLAIQEANIQTVDGAETTWELVGSEIEVAWRDGILIAPPTSAATVDVDLALLTPEPGFTTSGGRRGPIITIGAFLVGSVLILTMVIVADTWKRERDAQITAHLRLKPMHSTGSSATTAADREQSTDSEARSASNEL